MADILITGHRGYIGTHLAQHLPGFIGCDLKDGEDYRTKQFGLHNTVIHLAALVSVLESFSKPEEYLRNNALGLIPFFQNNTIRRFIFISTGGALYGNSLSASEDTASWLSCVSPYAQSKYLAEEIVRSMCPSHVILRLGNVYGGDYSVRGEANVHAHFAQDTPIAVYGGNQTRDFVHIDDVCRAVVTALADESIVGTFNIGSGKGTPIIEIAEEYSHQRGVPIEFLPEREGEIDYISLDITRAKQARLL